MTRVCLRSVCGIAIASLALAAAGEEPKMRSTVEQLEAAYRECMPPDSLAMTSASYTFNVTRNGRLTNVKVARSSGDTRLDEAGMCILGMLEFHPMIRNGVEIRSRANLELPLRPAR